MKTFEQALDYRYACKLFDHQKKISEQAIYTIVEAGRKSPSSFGLEPWHFMVIQSDKLKEILYPACWNQLQITTCSHFVLILFRKAKFFTKDSDYLYRAFQRKAGHDTAKIAATTDRFIHHMQKDVRRPDVEAWAIDQCHIAAANMMTASTVLGIDSCAIGGFDYKKLESLLNEQVPTYNPDDYGVALGITFGYRADQQTPQIRWAHDEITTYI